MPTALSENVKLDPNGFPSSMISPAEKGKNWCLKYLRAFHGEYSAGGGKILRYAAADYDKYRLYAEGRQPIDQYKQMLGTQKRKGKKDMSWRNLDWNILAILPTMVELVKNKVLGQQKDILITAIDPVSQNEERIRRNQLMAHIANLPLIQQAEQQFGVKTESPFDEGMPVPQNMEEIELHMQMFPKDRYIMETYDQIDRTMNLNGWKQIWNDVIDDLSKVGIGGTKTYLDVNGVIRVRRIIPERVITNNCMKADFSDMTRIGEYIQLSISELRASVPRGTFTEEDYARMASMASGTTYNTVGIETYFRTNYRYPYDNEKVLILDGEWFSADDFAYVKEISNRGNLNLEQQKDPYWLNRVVTVDENGVQRTGVSDQQYVDFHRAKGSNRVVLRDSVNNLYGGKWIVGTNYVYDWGLKSNMQRSMNRLGDCRSNYNLYTFFDSFIRKAEPIADDIQRNWLMYQTMQAQSKPNGLAINKRALTTMSTAGKGGTEFDELDMLQMYAETGNMVYKAEDAAGRPYPFDPIKELKGGLNEAAVQYLELIRNDIDMLRMIFGLNEATDGSTPNPKLGKAIAEMMEQNTNTALGSVYHAYSWLFEKTVESIALLIPDAELIKTMAKDEGLGESSGDFFRANNDVTFREMGIKIEDGPTNEAKMRLDKYVQLALTNQEINLEDAYLIETEPNLMRAFHLLTLKRKQKAQQMQQQQQQMFEIETQKNVQSAQATAGAKKDADLALVQAEVWKAQQLHPLAMEVQAATFTAQVILEKMKAGAVLDQQEEEAIARYRETFLKTQSQERIAYSQQRSQEMIAEENRKAQAQQRRAQAAKKSA